VKKSAKQALRAKNTDELKAESLQIRDGMLKSRLSTTLEGKRLSVSYRASRRQIARIMTIERERELAAERKAN
jgi:ribosomal protein L29